MSDADAAANTAPAGGPSGWAVLCFGDSLSLPRPFEGVHAHDVFGQVLVGGLREATGRPVSLVDRSGPRASIQAVGPRIVREVLYLERCAARVTAILQIGIADCAPRPVPERVRRIIERSPAGLRWRVVKVLHDHRATLQSHGASFRMTGPEEFERRFDDAVGRLTELADEVLVVGIFPTTAANEARSPGLEASIAAYNDVERRVALRHGPRVSFVPVDDLVSADGTGLAADGIHILAGTHRRLAERLAVRLDDLAPVQRHVG